MKTVEFLLYTLKPGTGNEFHRIMKEQSAPVIAPPEWISSPSAIQLMTTTLIT